MTTKTDLTQHLCLRLKAAWILGLEVSNNIKIYIYYFYISFIWTPSKVPRLLVSFVAFVAFNAQRKYHNDVATAVAGKKVANV